MKRQESAAIGEQPSPGGARRAVILEQLTRIQNSHAFGNSSRTKEFLAYVVEHALDGHNEPLKERSIGMDLFHRAPTYATGDDPIVRVKAAEVRRRLAQYYAEEGHSPEVRIEIPVGSYNPKFHWRSSENSKPSASEPLAIQEPAEPSKLRVRKIVVSAAVFAILGIVVMVGIRRHSHQESSLDEFWAPLFTTGQQVLICLPSPVAYEFSSDVYRKAGPARQELYDSHVKRDNTPLQLEPDTPLKWKDTVAVADFFVNKDDAYVAVGLSGLFSRIQKPSQVRIGHDFTFEDLRNSPAVLIGAYDNPWTDRMMSDGPFVFREQDNVQWIEETGSQGRVWRQEAEGREARKDFAIVARLVNSKTGQFLVFVGGVGMVGTQAAGRFVSRQADLDAALRTAPAGWQGKNLEVVLETDVIDGTASPPRVVAMKTW